MFSSYRSVRRAPGIARRLPAQPFARRGYPGPVDPTFEDLVADALDRLPPWVQERLENVAVIVEARPPSGEPGLLGRYEGIPKDRRGSGYFGVMPDRITLFEGSIHRVAGDDPDRLR